MAKSNVPSSFKTSPYPVFAAAALAGLALLQSRFNSVARILDFFGRGDVLFYDFVDTYWPMARAMREGSALPVDGFYYSPAFALFLKLFAFADPKVATAWWVAFLLTGSVLANVLGFRLIGRRYGAPLACAFIFLNLTSYFFWNNLFWGQLTEYALALVWLALWLHDRGRSRSAALALAAVCCIKYFFAVFVLPPLFKRDWIFIAAFALTGTLLLFVLPAISLGPAHLTEFYALVRNNMRGDLAIFARDDSNQFPPFVFNRLLANGLVPAAGVLFYASLLAAVGFVIARAVRLANADPTGASLATGGAIILMVPCLTPTAWEHYFYGLTFVQVVVAGRLLEFDARARRRAWAVGCLLTFAVLNTSIVPMILHRRGLHLWSDWTVPRDQAHFAFPLWTTALVLGLLAWTMVVPTSDRRANDPQTKDGVGSPPA